MQKALNKLKKERGAKWVLGVSGGVDSMVLFDLCKRAGVDVTVVHVNHKLRREAEADEKFVRGACRDAGVECRVLKKDVAGLARKWGGGVEEAGRRVRREFFEKVQKGAGAEGIILAHHKDDQVETVIVNMLRGAGVHGLSGMREWDGVYWRPMLEVGGEQVLRWAKKQGLEWREDKTNKDTRYKRNKVRWEFLPAVRSVDSDFDKKILELAKRARKKSNQKRKSAQKWLQKRGWSFLRNDFLELIEEERGEVLRELWLELHGSVEGFERERVREVARLLERNVGKKKVQFGNWWICLDKGRVSLRRYK